jgi:ABC-2 type transport system permease protein
MSTTTMPRPVRADDALATSSAATGVPFGRLLRVEWGRATDTRAARRLLALVALSTTGLMLCPLLAAGAEQSLSNYVNFAGVGLGILLPVVAILTLTSEWSQRTVLTTFTQEPRRIRVVLDVDPSAGLILGFGLFVLLNVLSGVALGALLHNSPAAIVVYFVLPTTFALLGAQVAVIAEWFDSSGIFNWLLLGQRTGHWPQIMVSTLPPDRSARDHVVRALSEHQFSSSPARATRRTSWRGSPRLRPTGVQPR